MTNTADQKNEQTYIDRPPRIQPPLPEQIVEIPPPPDKKGRNQGFAQILLPLLSILGYSLVSVFGGGRNIWFMLPMALSIVASTSFALYSFLKERRRIGELKRSYEDRLRMMRADMERTHHELRLYYEHTHPQIDTVYEIGQDRAQSRIGNRLWERRYADHDFASLRIGIGDIASRVVYTFENPGSIEEDPQIGEALQLAQDSQIVRSAPVIIPLRPFNPDALSVGDVVYSRHSMGISGSTPHVMDVTRAFVMQLSTFHTPTNFHIYVLGTSEADERWGWAKWLPHTNTGYDYIGDRMCFQNPLDDDEDPKKTKRMFPKRFLEGINKQLEERRLLSEENDGKKAKVDHPFILLIIDNLPEHEQKGTTEWVDALVSEAAIATILNNGATLSAGIAFLVPENPKIPSDCQSVYEIKVQGSDYTFRYSEIGQNSPRFVGAADHVTEKEAQEVAKAIRDKQIRQSYGADLRSSISILELYKTQTLEGLNIVELWKQSKLSGKEQADWIRGAIGIRSGNDIHEIYFNQDYDGVHGMIAGTTGSGKSEMLLTLIGVLAINYDPSILNFVLVDYKGGSAFEPFRNLPHCVNIVTNLDGKAVDRMFVAINSELKRRSKVLADYNVKHIVEYREKGYHIDNPFPHLFIIVDEFAEMINENKEYKSRFDSITRLGRAIGVSLILATQRPSGVVTDQMRANMKWRICLRVETGDDSRELLGHSDAMFLPSNIPGRAYIQVGKETPNLIQVARAGGDYYPPSEQENLGHIVLNADQKQLKKTNANEIQSIVDLIVSRTIELAKTHSVPQHKPWPDPLPLILPLNHPIDAVHLDTVRNRVNEQIVIHPRLRAWMLVNEENLNARERIEEWRNSQTVNWATSEMFGTHSIRYPLQTAIGIVDIPGQAKQRILSLDLTAGPIVLFGAGGWGKTSFLKTLIIGLAATHSPKDLWIYVMDFARGGLEDLAILPHMEKPIDVVEEARIERLLRVLSNILDERGPKVREYGSLVQYNAQNPDNILPAVLVVIDNFAEFKETYETQLVQLTNLIRNGRALGVYFVITADQVNAVPSKVYSLFTQRLSLKMADAGDYQGIVGRASHLLTEVPGRGVVSVDREPHEFHVGVITEIVSGNEDNHKVIYDSDYNPFYRRIAERMNQEWDHPEVVPKIESLSQHIDLQSLANAVPETQGVLNAAIGIRDVDRKAAWLELATHCLILGTPVSGKTTLLQSIVISMANRYTPQDLAFVLIDPRRLFFNYDLVNPTAKNRLGNLPHVLQTISEPEELDIFEKYLKAEFDSDIQMKIRAQAEQAGLESVFLSQMPKTRQLVIIIDNYDDIGDLERPRFVDMLATFVRKYRERIHLIVCGTPEIMRNRDAIIKRADTARYSIVLQSVETIRNLGGKVSYSLNHAELPVGRGFILKSRYTSLFQAARMGNQQHHEDNSIELLDAFITEQRKTYKGQHASWYFTGSTSLIEASFSNKSIAEQEPQYEEVEYDDKLKPFMDQIIANAKQFESTDKE